MTEQQNTKPSDREFYSIHNSAAQQEYVEVRRATKWAGFFIPHLHPGMSVLDCGCGVGSITLDLAELVAPAPVIGIDLDEKQLATARMRAEQLHIKNVSFEVGDAYRLRLPGASFDAVFAHTLLIHLKDRLKALREMRRVLKPGGVIGVSDDDFETLIFSPANPVIQRGLDIWIKFLQLNGADPFYSRHLRTLLREAGFVKTEGHAIAADYYGTLPETRRFAHVYDNLFGDLDISKLMLANGLCTQAELDSIRTELRRWGENPDAFAGLMYCAAVGWSPA